MSTNDANQQGPQRSGAGGASTPPPPPYTTTGSPSPALPIRGDITNALAKVAFVAVFMLKQCHLHVLIDKGPHQLTPLEREDLGILLGLLEGSYPSLFQYAFRREGVPADMSHRGARNLWDEGYRLEGVVVVIRDHIHVMRALLSRQPPQGDVTLAQAAAATLEHMSLELGNNR